MKKILLLSGSMRKESVNTKLLKAVEATTSAEVLWGSLEHPLFNEDVEVVIFPESVEQLKNDCESADVIFISTPEYNRGVPGPLKNALDWISRPYGKNSLTGKKVVILSASPGSLGGVVAHHQLITSLVHMGAQVHSGFEFTLSNAYDKFDDEGNLVDDVTKDHITKLLTEYGLV